MPPKQSTSAPRGRPSSKANAPAGKPRVTGKQRPQQRQQEESFTAAEDVDANDFANDAEEEDEDEGQPKTIPPELLTRILHEFFENEGTRITKDANGAVARYMDIFVREAIARAAVERDSGFLEVEDLEKVAPQLLLDL